MNTAALPAPAVFLTGAAGALPSRTVAALDAIKRAILAGELKPGQPLVETDLAETLGVSKTPVREALKTLAGTGLVTMSPYKGAVVRTIDDDQARHLYDVRILLEPEALSRSIAAGHGWALARTALDRAAHAQAQDHVTRSLANREFHGALYAGCGNPLLIAMIDDLRDQTALVSITAWRHSATWECEAAEHQAILTAAEAGDATAATRLLCAHIAAFARRYFPLNPLESTS